MEWNRIWPYLGALIILLIYAYKLKKDEKEKLRVAELQGQMKGFDRGQKSEQDRILGNFDSTQNINMKDFYLIIDTLKAKGFELVYNPVKNGYDIRKQIFSPTIEIEEIEI